MSNTTSTHSVLVTDGGTLPILSAKVKNLNAELDGAAKRSKAVNAAMEKSKPVEATRMYDQARAGVGTGAEGRDFAKQSQGLGGLVRVYATFAANIFAVSAAFNALSRAADTTNLVEGLNQLGAASGRSLGTLAKDIVKATDNAVSLREAMTATAQATSAGMSDKDVLRLATGAKKASQALGVDMSDALSRLSRGITKLEPELLDEIGIFVRVDRASQDYAKSIGKPVSALTDLEKRAAFANAALSQVESKFGAVDIPSNPYTQLLASLKNISTTGLELVNKVLGPLVKLLSESPAALSAVLLGIAGTLVNQALPAIGQYRKELKETAILSKEIAASRAADADTAVRQVREASVAPIRAELDAITQAKVDAVDKAEARLLASSKKGLDKKTLNILKDSGLLDITKNIDKELTHLDEMGKKVNKSSGELTKVSANYRELATSIRQARSETEKYFEKEVALRKTVEAPLGRFTAAKLLADKALAAENKATRMTAVANASDAAAMYGFTDAVKRLNTEVNSSNLTGFSKALTLVSGTAAAATTRVIALGTAFMAAFGWIAALVGIGSMLISWLKDNEKQADAATESLSRLEESGDNLSRTFTSLSKLNPLERMSAQGLSAQATAFENLTASMVSSIEKVDAEVASRDTSEKLVSFFSGMFNSNSESDLAENIAKSVTTAISIAGSSPDLIDSKNRLLALTQNKTGSDLVNLIKKTPGLQEKITQEYKLSAASLKILSASSTEAVTSMNTLATARTDLLNSFKSSDVVTTFGTTLISASVSLSAALENPLGNLTAIRDTAKDLSMIGIFPESTVSSIDKLTTKLEGMQEEYYTLIKAADDYANKAKKPLLSLDETTAAMSKATDIRGKESAVKAAENIKRQDFSLREQESRKQADKLKEGIASGGKLLQSFALEGLKLGADLVNMKIQEGFAKAETTVARARLAGAFKSQETIKKTYELDRQEINSQISVINVMEKLAASGYAAADALDKIGAEEEVARIKASPNTLERREQTQLGKAQGTLSFLKLKEDIFSSKNVSKRLTEEINKAVENKDVELTKRLSGLTNQAQIMSGFKVQKAQGAASSDASRLAEGFASMDLASETAQKNLRDTETSRLDTISATLEKSKSLNAISDLTYATEKGSLEENRLTLEYKLKQVDAQNNLDKTIKAGSGVAAAEAEKQAQTDAYVVALNNLQTSNKTARLLAEQADSTKLISTLNAKDAQVEANKYDATIGNYNTKLEELEVLKSRDSISTDSYNLAKADLQNSLLLTEDAKERFEITTKSNAAQEALNLRAKTAKESGTSDKAVTDQIAADRAKEVADTDQATQALDRKSEARRREIALITQQSAQAIRLEEAEKNAADTLSGAFFDATQTGKFEFTDMVNSMILDLARLEFKATMMKYYMDFKGANGGSVLGGLAGAISSFFSPTTAGAANPMQLDPMQMAMAKAANGRAYSSGVEMFAKGGSFTNSIVDTPTMFKFAKGTGLMGEAGPEAIMPLKRDASGRLGVSAGGSSTQVVVNNYSKEEATVTESVDSRGNKRIDVQVGDMVAKEMVRAGSSAQQSIKNTFGRQPQLIRR